MSECVRRVGRKGYPAVGPSTGVGRQEGREGGSTDNQQDRGWEIHNNNNNNNNILILFLLEMV